MAGNTPVLVHNCGTSVDDLRNAKPIEGHGIDPDKAADMRNWSDDDLLASFNTPRDGGVAQTNENGTIVNGHHRINELIRRADDPNNKRITGSTKVRIEQYRRDLSDFWDLD